EIVPLVLNIPLSGESIINRIAFRASKDMIKSELRYKDSFGISRTKRLYWYVENKVDGVITIGVEEFAGKLRVHTEEAEILVYGTLDAEFVNVETLPLENFLIRIEADNKIDLKNAFYNESKTSEYVNIKEQCFISEIKSKTEENVKVFVKDSGRSSKLSWDELAEKKEYVQIGTLQNGGIKLNRPYFTDEIMLESSSGESFIRGLELYKYNTIENEVENLFKNDSYSQLKENVTFEMILDLESRVRVDGIYIGKIRKAKSLFLENSLIEKIEFEFEISKIMSEIKFITLETPHKIELIYKNPTGDIERKNCNFTIDDEEVKVNFEKIYVERAEFRVHGVERAYKIKSDAINIDSYIVQTDRDEKFDFNPQNSTITSTENGSYTDYFIALNKEEIFYKFKTLSKANIFIKDMFSGNYIEFKENAGVLESDKSYLVKEFLVRSHNHLSKESLLESIKGYRLSRIKLAVD
ncbi:MAG: hypothetical protein ACRC4S_00620, partial [Cetobacterium sp.]